MSKYSILGSNCVQQTIALTSNQKFLPPLDNIYSGFYIPRQEENTLYKVDQYNIITESKKPDNTSIY